MNQEVKKKWVNALRSGEYLPTEYHLTAKEQNMEGEYVERHCALGVLCDIAVNEGVIPPSDWDQRQDNFGEVMWVRTYSDPVLGAVDDVLPLDVMVWADLPNCNPSLETTVREYDWDVQDIVEVEGSFEISALNDKYDVDFREIADLIDGQL